MGLNYNSRFDMPGDNGNLYFAFTMGPALFVGFSTEVYFTDETGSEEKARQQREWLENVFTEANRSQFRARFPWLIGLGHRSLYCSTNEYECVNGITIEVSLTSFVVNTKSFVGACLK